MSEQKKNRTEQADVVIADDGVAMSTNEVEADAEFTSSAMPVLYVERRSFTWKNEKKYAYEVNVVLRGHKLKIELAPKDMGGYAALEIVFEGVSKLPLEISLQRYKDDFKRTKYNFSYEVRSADGILTCPLWPKVRSDGTKLEMLIAQEVALRKAAESVTNE